MPNRRLFPFRFTPGLDLWQCLPHPYSHLRRLRDRRQAWKLQCPRHRPRWECQRNRVRNLNGKALKHGHLICLRHAGL